MVFIRQTSFDTNSYSIRFSIIYILSYHVKERCPIAIRMGKVFLNRRIIVPLEVLNVKKHLQVTIQIRFTILIFCDQREW